MTSCNYGEYQITPDKSTGCSVVRKKRKVTTFVRCGVKNFSAMCMEMRKGCNCTELHKNGDIKNKKDAPSDNCKDLK